MSYNKSIEKINLQTKEKEEKTMKKFLFKYGHIVSAFALFMTTIVANRACGFIFHQPKLPNSANRLRKF